ncbi:hypothetical protein SAMN05443550_10534 [Pedobacter hartonius]|uniref:Uncharacterized protein n=1 Tax=Pedobacter hartonius TaxID=425514 RepID=A0A1H4DQ93_9SPHI|nr:hypothetical protein SAMN05443550_10534 [Pedobacter hartonius]
MLLAAEAQQKALIAYSFFLKGNPPAVHSGDHPGIINYIDESNSICIFSLSSGRSFLAISQTSCKFSPNIHELTYS